MARMRWDASRQTWVPDAVSGGGTVGWSDVADKPALFPPSGHAHTFTDLPSGVLGYAVGANTPRPAAGLVIWFAASEPPAMVNNDFLIMNPIYG